ncbi:MAG: 2-oxo acid dehydrogenase subunit E2 [Actinobacteria bacterium]|nr:2-oxo acid dehydrogenase subunit E2 [Actinomycetota bacterium]
MPELMRMPGVAAGATEAILAAWNVEPGKPFAAGDVVVTVETDKAVVDVEAEADGVLLRVLADAGATVEVGGPIALLGVAGEQVDDVERVLAELGVEGAEPAAVDEQVAAAPEEASEAAVSPAPPAAAPGATAPAPAGGGRVFASPLARKVAREAGVPLEQLAGTGPDGRIRRRDVDAYLASRPAATPAAAAAATAPARAAVVDDAEYWDEPNSRMRTAIAARLAESKQTAPHFYVKGSAKVDRLLEMRREINEGTAVKVSVNDLVVKAVAKAHTLVPGLNVIWTGDAVRHFARVDVAVAVATDNGLVTPVVRGVDRLSVTELAAATQDLVSRAKDKRLQQSELEGGTVSVSNLGMYGTEEFSAILNPPQSSILAVGAARLEPVVVDGRIEAATVLRVTLSVDHRPVDGATAAQWMQVFTDLLEHPARILA